MKNQLDVLLSEEELKDACDRMAKMKSPGPDGIVVEMFQLYWEFLGTDFIQMVECLIERENFLPGIINGTLVLMHEGGSRDSLGNWRPIILLNTSLKWLLRYCSLGYKKCWPKS